jgi:hypothetical protein
MARLTAEKGLVGGDGIDVGRGLGLKTAQGHRGFFRPRLSGEHVLQVRHCFVAAPGKREDEGKVLAKIGVLGMSGESRFEQPGRFGVAAGAGGADGRA